MKNIGQSRRASMFNEDICLTLKSERQRNMNVELFQPHHRLATGTTVSTKNCPKLAVCSSTYVMSYVNSKVPSEAQGIGDNAYEVDEK
ncbi:hypothetical protein TNCV_4856441 [Trichonephila clavipes]|nr:hypothetical protein TNCV_4856441 [Trichonephila clavipes]